MGRKTRDFLIACWKAELRAAERAVDRVAELMHRAMAARYARMAAEEYAHTDPRLCPQRLVARSSGN
ncbi:hypothetical protein [Sphingomonas cavernae]|uniref:Uncharacterized protein n=1 Tax=Sphingomonas cavernae TaxID=2320861 RepID=A0A418W766_9SPHN|nr:hypothetical protein [Sphingomonas cavernae]RJF85807.1 hypothetical protein D3876_18200 [Sphingomonas cavernae]